MKPKNRKPVSAAAGVDAAFLAQCLRQGVVRLEDIPSQSARLRRLQRICRSLELDVFAGSMILDLVERMDEMRRDLDWLRGQIQG